MPTSRVRQSPPCSLRKPPTIPLEVKLRTADRAKERDRALAWRRSTKGQIFRFLDLPPELRDRIYSYLCTSYILTLSCRGRGRNAQGDGGSASDHHARCMTPKHPCNHQPALARTCRQVRAELLPMFYARNVFQLVCTRRLAFNKRWVDAVARRHCRHLRRVRIVRESPSKDMYNIDIAIRSRRGRALEDAITVRTSTNISRPQALSLAGHVTEAIKLARLALEDGTVAVDALEGYALLQAVIGIDGMRHLPPWIYRDVYQLPVDGPHWHCLIYPEMLTFARELATAPNRTG